MGSGELEEEDPPSLRFRAFFGLPVPEPQREELAPFLKACAQAAPEFRWTPKDNLHLTVRFIGRVDRWLVESVADALGRRPLSAFEMELGEIGSFGRGRAARVVWLGLRAGTAGAAGLAAQVDEECVKAGLPSESRPYQAHLTLARARPRDGARLPELPAMPHLKPWWPDRLVLYSSRLGRTGATYVAMRTLELA
ncbi:MAG TPA: RNA 2',3'-cyclic phosphodiesterase [Candidatus Micrarchaeaceae archaeon]|nr:RNA 2',3'-cyclic phosphodiesterase [Candidatus Micrarchaeaceae archaeon]